MPCNATLPLRPGTRVAYYGVTGRVLRADAPSGGRCATYEVIGDSAYNTYGRPTVVPDHALTVLPPLLPGAVVYVLHGAETYSGGMVRHLFGGTARAWNRLCVVVNNYGYMAEVRAVDEPGRDTYLIDAAHLTPATLPEPGRLAQGTPVAVFDDKYPGMGRTIRRVYRALPGDRYQVSDPARGNDTATIPARHMAEVPPGVSADNLPVSEHRRGWHPEHGYVVVLRVTGHYGAPESLILPLDAEQVTEAVTVSSDLVFAVLY